MFLSRRAATIRRNQVSTVEYRSPIHQYNTYDTVMTAAERKSHFRHTTYFKLMIDTPQFAHEGMSFVRIVEKIDCVITAPYWRMLTQENILFWNMMYRVNCTITADPLVVPKTRVNPVIVPEYHWLLPFVCLCIFFIYPQVGQCACGPHSVKTNPSGS